MYLTKSLMKTEAQYRGYKSLIAAERFSLSDVYLLKGYSVQK